MALRPVLANLSTIIQLRHIRRVIGVGLGAAALFVACSSDQQARDRAGSSGPGSSAGGGPGSTTTGLLTGPGAGGAISTTGAGGGGGTGQPPLVPCDPPGMPCPMGQICVKAPPGMTGGVCSKDGGSCTLVPDT